MAFFHLLLAVLQVAISVNAAAVGARPPTVAPLTRLNRLNLRTVVKSDQARVRSLLRKDASVEPITNDQAVTYLAAVGVGSPPTTYNLIVDTGSSNTWVGATTQYAPTSTSSDTGATVSVSYGSGSFSGEEYIDQVTLSDSLVIAKQSIGVASTSSGFTGVDGIIGIGPVALTSSTLSTGGTIPTVTDNLFANGAISSNSIGVFFTPPTATESGEISWGGVDTSKTTSDVSYVPVTQTSPASQYWGIDESITYGSTSILSTTAGIVDTGTTLILLATDAYQSYVSATGATLDSTTGLLTISADQVSNLQTLSFVTSGGTFDLVPNAQYFPPSLNTELGGVAGTIYLVVGDLGSPSGQGLDFINGQAFLERFYSVFDTANHQVGFATTAHTTETDQ